MPPPLALLLTILLIFYLLRKDSGQRHEASRALWIPWIWLMILGSRSVSTWLNLGSPLQSADDLMEGSPLDRTVFLVLIVAGLRILWRRQISWHQVFRNNIWLTLFFLYCALSILWSDFPFVACKRWIKGLGDPMMAMILLTDSQPIQAVATVIKRCAYFLIPLSILFIKYYPTLGRAYDGWTGAQFYTGVTTDKNMLGLLCLVFGLFFLCQLCAQWGKGHESGKKGDLLVTLLLLWMILWLLSNANSKTPLLSLIVGSLVVMALGLRHVRRYVGRYIVVGIFVFAILELSFDISGSVTSTVGRDATLTGRTELWKELLDTNSNPLFGAGFESFWLGDRLKRLWSEYLFRPNQAHNGYIEIYLNLGWIGLALLGGVILAHYRKIRRTMTEDDAQTKSRGNWFNFARFRMAFLVAYLIYNITEGAFKELSFLFVIFLIVAIEPQPHQEITELSLGSLPGTPRNAAIVTADPLMTAKASLAGG